MDTITITPCKEGMDPEQTKREMDIHADGYKQGYKDATDKACEVYETELRQMKRILNEIQDGAGEIISVGGSLTEFRKALEE